LYSTETKLDNNSNNFVRKLCPAMINVFQESFVIPYKKIYSMGGINGNPI
jgi:hypothetical protein